MSKEKGNRKDSGFRDSFEETRRATNGEDSDGATFQPGGLQQIQEELQNLDLIEEQRRQNDNDSSTGVSAEEDIDEYDTVDSSDNEDTTDVMSKPVMPVMPQYSGKPRGESYQSPTGQVQELNDVSDWLGTIERISISASWSDAQKANNASLVIVPNTPADDWYRVNRELKQLDNWANFKKAITEQFEPKMTQAEKAEYLKTMKQDRHEKGRDYVNRIQRKFNRFSSGLTETWETGDFKTAETANTIAPFTSVRALREAVVEKCMSYVFQPLVMAGLTEANMAEVTKNCAMTVAEMVDICDRTEAAMKQSGAKRVSAIQEETAQTESRLSEDDIVRIAAAIARKDSGKSKQQSQSKGKPSKGRQITCFHCGEAGHIAPRCEVRKQERAKGIYRPNTQAPNMTKSEFEALSEDEKKGRKPINRSAPNIGSVQASQDPWGMYSAQGN